MTYHIRWTYLIISISWVSNYVELGYTSQFFFCVCVCVYIYYYTHRGVSRFCNRYWFKLLVNSDLSLFFYKIYWQHFIYCSRYYYSVLNSVLFLYILQGELWIICVYKFEIQFNIKGFISIIILDFSVCTYMYCCLPALRRK